MLIRGPYRPALSAGIGFAKGNVWSRSARRKQQHGSSSTQSGDAEMADGDDPALGFKISLRLGQEEAVNVMVRWLQGKDSVLFESFCGMLKRQLGS